ncbi:hypothetical protein [Gabonibacter massiliensis]|uniref:hypothetical protein n=1 Tax=Gabonibacter massiliensis TaxID=1720195 RepID=UPI00073E4B06|nr:hypothetical protein [Gabonibacter massiliensis]
MIGRIFILDGKALDYGRFALLLHSYRRMKRICALLSVDVLILGRYIIGKRRNLCLDYRRSKAGSNNE